MGINANILHRPISIAGLAGFRMLFGALMVFSIIRFASYGWIQDLYIAPENYFTYYGFDWIQPLGNPGMYILFGICGLSALGIMLGCYYRLSSILFFLSFTYIELIDKTNYLNHYYFVSIIAFILLWLPAHRAYSIDVIRKPELKLQKIPRWMVLVIQLQLGLTYFFAGVAKLHPDWLFAAMPLKIWLPPHATLPIIGSLMTQEWTAYFFSWFGAIYDLSIPFLLFWKRSTKWAYLAVLAFHVMTAILFQIGVFPYVMIACTLVFFSPEFFERIFQRLFPTYQHGQKVHQPSTLWLKRLLLVHFSIQLLLPFRYMLYPGNLFWTEQGYRFSWRVMLMEKAGSATFYVSDDQNRWSEIYNGDYLTKNQEKMMATQPDMILQFAHLLRDEAIQKGISEPKVKAEVYVTLNGERSRLFIDKDVNLAAEKQGLAPKKWILPH